MALHVLDTDMLSLFQESHPAVVSRVIALSAHEVVVTVISVEEQLSGWYTLLRRTRRRDELARVYQRLADCVQTLSCFRVLSFTEPAIDRYEDLKAQRLNVSKPDLRIAAITLENAGIVVTRNVRDFTRVPGLPVVNWVP